MPSLYVRTIDPNQRVPSNLYSSYYRLLSHLVTPLRILLNYICVPTAILYCTHDKTVTHPFAVTFTD